ncbi:hypothetical protein BKA66DRAFT_571766 [Pyrenochaeta sp. MPI-SDFR-AT-0127]|nr:hypothetical protein BKA66DRAFT_571766 [Pyrenochaeta sp. MPI-SDFR-AT-0127]
MVQGLNSESQDTLNRLLHELKGSRNELKSLRERAAALEDSLSRYEYQLQRIEEDVYQELDRELQDNRAPHEPHLESSSAGIIEPKTHDTGTATELRDMLYSRMGDIRIHLERLNNFEFDLQDELQERDILRAAGNAEVTTDAEFFEHARGERARIQQELEDAQVEVSKLKERCIQNNIGFEDPQFAEVLYQPGMDSLVTASGLGEPQMEEHQGSSTIINAFFNAQERIKQWLEKPSGSPNSEPDATKEARQEWTRRDSSSSDAGWVMTPSLVRPPSSLRTVGMNGLAESELPQWRAGPPPGSSLIEALLLESSSTPLGYGHQPKTNITVKARQSLP